MTDVSVIEILVPTLPTVVEVEVEPPVRVVEVETAGLQGAPGSSGATIATVASDQAADGTVTLRFVMTDGQVHEVRFEAGSTVPTPGTVEISGHAIAEVVATATVHGWLQIAAATAMSAFTTGEIESVLEVAGTATSESRSTVRTALRLTASGAAQASASSATHVALALELASHAVAVATSSAVVSLGAEMAISGTAVAIVTSSSTVTISLAIGCASTAQATSSGTVVTHLPIAGSAVAVANSTGAVSGRLAIGGSASAVAVSTGSVTLTAPPAATMFRDDFNRADGPLTAGSSDWTNVSGNANALSISGNQVATASAEGAFESPDIKNANHYVQALIVGGGAVGPFLVCRMTDQNNWGAAMRFNVNTGSGQLWKRQGGTLTQYGSTTGSPCVVGATVRVETVGDQAQIVANGVVVAGPYSMGGSAAGITRQGVVTRTNANNPWIDNYEAGVLSALTA